MTRKKVGLGPLPIAQSRLGFCHEGLGSRNFGDGIYTALDLGGQLLEAASDRFPSYPFHLIPPTKIPTTHSFHHHSTFHRLHINQYSTLADPDSILLNVKHAGRPYPIHKRPPGHTNPHTTFPNITPPVPLSHTSILLRISRQGKGRQVPLKFPLLLP